MVLYTSPEGWVAMFVLEEELGTQPERRGVGCSPTFAFFRVSCTPSAQCKSSPRDALGDCLCCGFLFKEQALHTEMLSATT